MVVTDLKAICDLKPRSMVPSSSPSRNAAHNSFHQRIRRETRTAHDIVDDAMSVFDLQDAKAYGRFLGHHAQALAALRSQVRAEDRSDVQEMANRIEEDLRGLGVGDVVTASPSERLDGFGVAYVLRGSRMGARILRARIGPGLPTRYMDFTPALTWRDFLAELETHAAGVHEPGRRHIIVSAQWAFEAFGSARPSAA